MPTATPPPGDSDDVENYLRSLTENSGISRHPGHPVLGATEWVVVVFTRDDKVAGCNHYTDLVEVLTALDDVGENERAEVHAKMPLTIGEYEAAARYIVPALAPGTDAHIRDDDRDPGDGNDGWAACGTELRYEDRWIDVPAAAVAGVCSSCRVITETEVASWG